MKKKIFSNNINEYDFSEQEKPIEWEINAEVDFDKKLQALEHLKNGMNTRKVSQFLGILVHQIVRK